MSASSHTTSQTDPAHLFAAGDLRLAPASGQREAALFDAASVGGIGATRPAQVTRLLAAGYLRPHWADGDDWPLALSIADRQIALFRLALDHGQWPAWFVTRCECCGKPADLTVAADEFTVTPAPAPLPATLELHGPSGRTVAHVPTGHTECALAGGADPLALCLPDTDTPKDWAAPLEQALQSALPHIRTELRFDCPECGQETGFWFDPVDWTLRHSGAIFHDVDRLARAYGWSEAAILSMTPARRQTYLNMTAQNITGGRA